MVEKEKIAPQIPEEPPGVRPQCGKEPLEPLEPLGTEFLASPLGTVAMPLSQMFDKVFGMIKSDMYVIKLQEKEEEL